MNRTLPASELIKMLSTLTKEELLQIKGIGEVLADNLISFTKSKRYEQLIEGFKNLENSSQGVQIEIPTAQSSGELNGKIFVITGSFDIPRNQIKELLESKGAKVVDAVTSSTSILLAGEKAGSKLAKAEKLGIQISSDYRMYTD